MINNCQTCSIKFHAVPHQANRKSVPLTRRLWKGFVVLYKKLTIRTNFCNECRSPCRLPDYHHQDLFSNNRIWINHIFTLRWGEDVCLFQDLPIRTRRDPWNQRNENCGHHNNKRNSLSFALNTHYDSFEVGWSESISSGWYFGSFGQVDRSHVCSRSSPMI